MADLQISQLPSLAEANIAATDELAIVDTSASETKKVTAKALVEKGVALIDAGSIPGTALASLGANTVVTNSITDANVTNVKLANSSISLGGLSLSLGSTDATPALDLTDATNYPTSSLTGTITNAQLAGSIANNKLANSSISIGGVSISLGTTIATPALNLTSATNYPTSSLTGTITNAQLAGSIANAKLANSSINIGGITFNLGDSDTSPALDLSDATSYPTSSLTGTITNAQLAGSITGSKLTDGTITATQLAANSVTASELADNAVDSGAIAASAVVDAKIASGIGGAKITDGTITATKLATANIDRSLNVANNNLGINNTVTAATRSGITYNAQGLITGTVALAASDLPLATTSAVGGVSVGTGLAVTGAGALSLSNSVTAATISGITYNAQGQITSTTALAAGDLPAATTSAKGAVLITSGGGISVDGSGAISTSTSGITAGTYTKVTINNKGVATAGASLVSGDIPDLSATKLTSGTLNIGRFATNSILGSKFADSSVCQFTGAQSTSGVVTFPTAEFKGQFFYDLTNDDLYVYDGSAFQPVTITSGEIIYAGNYRADTNKITSLTAAGTAQGYTVGAALQAASAANNRYYFVCDKSGTGTSPAPTVTINPPDMILSNGSTYEKLDISNFIAGQVASNIGVTATGGIQNTNVQSVLEELDTEKLNTTGGTLTGNLALNQSSSIIFEGATPNDFESTLTVIDPTADRTLSLPNVTGTLVSSGDTGTVTSTMILDGTILNADINASAAIALTKLANVTAAHIIVGNASNVPTAVAVTGDISISNAGLVAITADSIINADIKSDAAISGSKIVAGTTSVVGVVQLVDSATSTSTTLAATGASVKVAKDAADAAATTANAALPTTGGTLTNNLIIDNAKQIRFAEADSNGANFVSLQAPDTLAADVSYTLPSAAPTASGQVLASTTGGVLSWTEDPAGQWVTSGNDISYSAGNVTIDTNTFHVDAANNRVGIGVASPVDKLNVAGAVRINQSTTLDHLCNAGTVLEVRGDGIGSGVVDTDFFKGFKIALNDGPEFGGQAQFAVGRWEENGTNARSSLMISLGHGGISSSSNADADVLLLNSNKNAEFFGALTVASDIRATGASDVRLTLGSTGTVDTNDSVHVRADGANLNFMAASGGITKFEVDGTETLSIAANGNCGLGISSATEKLHVIGKVGGTNPTAGSKWDIARFVAHDYSPTNSGGLTIGAYWNNSTVSGRTSYIQSSQSTDSGNTVRPLLLNPDGGNVGINDTSPANLLSLKSSAPVLSIKDTASYTAYTNGGKIYFQGTDSDGAANKTFAGIKGVSQSSNNGQLRLQSRNSGTLYDRLTIDAVGRIGLYTITSPVATLHQKSHSNGWDGGILLEEQNATTGWNIHPDNNDQLMIGRNTDTSTSSSTHIASFTTDGLKFVSGKGIDFSATGDGSSSPNELLDEYEEGYWDLSGTNCNVDLHDSYDRGWYVKVGHMVTCGAYVQSDETTTETGSLTFTLPFATSAAPVGGDTGWIGSCSLNSFTLDASITQSSIAAGDAGALATIRLNGGHAVGWTSMKKNQFVDGKLMQFTLTYKCQ